MTTKKKSKSTKKPTKKKVPTLGGQIGKTQAAMRKRKKLLDSI